MTRTATLVLAATLAGAPGLLFCQSQSPDQQQGSKGDSDSKHSTPNTGQAQSGQSPDIQQEKNAGSKHRKKSQTNARQGHGTPQPKTDTSSTR